MVPLRGTEPAFGKLPSKRGKEAELARRSRFRTPARKRPRRATPVSNVSRLFERGSQIALIGLFTFAVCVVLDQAMFFFAPLAAAIVLALVLGPPATRLERLGLPEWLAAVVMLLTVLAVGALLAIALAIPMESWVERAPEAWAKMRSALYDLREQLSGVMRAREDIEEALNAGEGGATVTVEEGSGTSFTNALSLAPAVAGQALIFLGTFYFYMATRHDLRRTFLSFCTSRAARVRVGRIFRDMEIDVSSYLTSIALINVCFGACVTGAMLLLGMPSPGLWGILAAVMNFMPYLGPALMALIIFSAGIISFETVGPAITAASVFVGLNVLEGQFVTPSVIGRRMMLNPFLVFATLTFWLWLWGAIGAFLAVPLLLIGRTLVVHLLPQTPDVPAFRGAVARARAEAAAAREAEADKLESEATEETASDAGTRHGASTSDRKASA